MNLDVATIDDAFGIAEVHVQSWQGAYKGILGAEFLREISVAQQVEKWKSILKSDSSQTIVARKAEKIVGFVAFGPWRGEGSVWQLGEIFALYVLPAYWGFGIGFTLLDKAMQALGAGNTKSVCLWVLEENSRGIAFYQKAGFLPVAGAAKICEIGGRQVVELLFRSSPAA